MISILQKNLHCGNSINEIVNVEALYRKSIIIKTVINMQQITMKFLGSQFSFTHKLSTVKFSSVCRSGLNNRQVGQSLELVIQRGPDSIKNSGSDPGKRMAFAIFHFH